MYRLSIFRFLNLIFAGRESSLIAHVNGDKKRRRADEKPQKVPGDSGKNLLAPGIFIDAKQLHLDHESRKARVTRFSISGILK